MCLKMIVETITIIILLRVQLGVKHSTYKGGHRSTIARNTIQWTVFASFWRSTIVIHFYLSTNNNTDTNRITDTDSIKDHIAIQERTKQLTFIIYMNSSFISNKHREQENKTHSSSIWNENYDWTAKCWLGAVKVWSPITLLLIKIFKKQNLFC